MKNTETVKDFISKFIYLLMYYFFIPNSVSIEFCTLVTILDGLDRQISLMELQF